MKENHFSHTATFALIIFIFLGNGNLVAQDERYLGPVSDTYAIVNATIWQGPGRTLRHATLLLTQGLIAQVGTQVIVPSGAVVINGNDQYIYPGFITGLTQSGVKAFPKESSAGRVENPGNPPPQTAGITPERDVRDVYDCSKSQIDEFRTIGFTTAQVVPCGGMLPGYGAILPYADAHGPQAAVLDRSALFSELVGSEGGLYPGTTPGVMAKWRDLYRQSSISHSYEQLYASNPAGIGRPVADRVMEAFYPIIDGQKPVLFRAQKLLEIERVLDLQHDLGFRLVLGEVKEGWDAIGRIKNSGAEVFLSLQLPDAEKKQDKESSTLDDEESTIIGMSDEERGRLMKRKQEAIASCEGQAAVFHQAGIRFGFSTLCVNAKSVRENLGKMIKAGLLEEDALSALTIDAAGILGVQDRLGSIDAGKIANVIVCDKPYFAEGAKVTVVFIDGRPYEPKTHTGDRNEDVAIAGNWAITTVTPDGKTEGLLTIRKMGEKYTGTISGGKLSTAVDLEKIEMKGRRLTFGYTVRYQDQSMKIEVKAEVTGDHLKGTAYAGSVDQFPLEGVKKPE